MADISTILGVAAANVASVNGVAIANIASIHGATWPAGGGGLSTPSLLNTTASVVNETTIVSASVAPSVSSLVLVFISWHKERTISSVVSGFTTGGWNAGVFHNPASAGADPGVSVYWANFTSGTGTVTVTFNSATLYKAIAIVEITGHNTTTPIINTKVADDEVGTTASLTLDSSPAADAIVLGLITQDADADGITPGAQFTELADHAASDGSDDLRQQVQYDETTPGTTVDWSALSDADKAYCGLEIQAA